VIRVENTATGLDVSIRADAEGRYYIPALLAGTYIVSAEAPGFRTEGVEAVKSGLMQRLNVRSTADLVRYALDHGIVT
jgi:hypothetical protein